MYKVFISSTYMDLIPYRDKAVWVCHHLNLHPVMMEAMNAMDADAADGSIEKLKDCDVMVGIYAHRYGTIPPDNEYSVTEQEYDYAVENDIPRLCFLVDDEHPWSPKFIDMANYSKLSEFKEKVKKERIASFFTSIEDFGEKLTQALAEWKENKEETGGDVSSSNNSSINIEGKVSNSTIFTQDIQYGNGATHIENQTIINPDLKEIEDKQEQAARKKYLRQLRKFCQNLLLVPLGEEDTVGASIHLDDVYIELNTRTPKPEQNEPGKERTEPDPFSREQEDMFTALEVAQQHSHLVILGDPGSGKSTFAKRLLGLLTEPVIALQDFLKDFPKDLLPVFINLRDIVPLLQRVNLPEDTEVRCRMLAEMIIQQAVTDLKEIHQTPDFEQGMSKAIQTGECFLVLDGFDEVPQAMRALVRETVAALMRCYHVERLLVTCRIRSYEGDAVLEAFPAHTLAPLKDDQIRKFCADWYRKQSEIGRVEIQEHEQKADDLTTNAINDEKLKELAENPMLLTSMAIVHQRDTKLPPERVKLFKEVVRILLLRWQEHHGNQHISEELKGFLKDENLVNRCMEHLAFEAHRLGQGDKEAADLLRRHARNILEDEYLKSAGLAEEFLDYIDQRSGILTGRGGEVGRPGSYAFPHRTFQEYLAGCYLAGSQDPFEMLDQFRKIAAEGDFWDVAALMAFEELKYNRPSAALRYLAYELSKDYYKNQDSGHRLVMWTGQISGLIGKAELERSGERGLQFLKRIKFELQKTAQTTLLNPVERAETANALDALDWQPEDLYKLIEIPGDENQPTFWMGKYPVTNVEYARFLQEKNFKDQELWLNFHDYVSEGKIVGSSGLAGWKWLQKQLNETEQSILYPRYWDDLQLGYARKCVPIVGISWYEANAYCHWLLKNWGTLQEAEIMKDLRPKGIQLPLEYQWEKAAGGTEHERYPWWIQNEEVNQNTMLQIMNTIETGIGKTTPVWMYPQGKSHPYGLMNMAGNVWEWQLNHDGRFNGYRILRGGAFNDLQGDSRCASRSRFLPGLRYLNFGFRICLTPSNVIDN